MKILYIYRNKTLGFSIANVFTPIEEEMKKHADVDSFYLPAAGAKPWHLWKNVKAACQKADSQPYDVIHITGSVDYLVWFLRRKHKIVVTVHDLGFFINHKVTPRTVLLYLFWIYVLKYANKVTCISRKTSNEVLRLVKLSPSQLCTIDNPVSPIFRHKAKAFNVACPIILHIGTKPNKNLNNTILALRDFPCHLRIIGTLDSNIKALLDIYKISYSQAVNLTNEEVVREYENCDIVNFPSLDEGFGMPIIEGQAVGRVVVTSDLPPMNEIVGSSAVLVNPTNVRSILEGYKKAIAQHENIIYSGLENVKQYSVAKIAKEYYNVYKEVAQCK